MRHFKTLMTLIAVSALGLPVAARAAGEDMGGMHKAKLDIVEVTVQKPDIIEVNTGRKMKMSDGDRHKYYETHEARNGNILLDVRMQMVTAGGGEHAMFDPRSVQLVDPDRKDAEPILPFARFVGQDWMKMDQISIPVDYKAGMQFAFEVPQDMLAKMVLHINGRDMGPVTKLIDTTQEKKEEAGS